MAGLLLAVLLGMSILAVGGCMAAYRNGVHDGYGYARNPRHPGYRHVAAIVAEGDEEDKEYRQWRPS